MKTEIGQKKGTRKRKKRWQKRTGGREYTREPKHQ